MANKETRLSPFTSLAGNLDEIVGSNDPSIQSIIRSDENLENVHIVPGEEGAEEVHHDFKVGRPKQPIGLSHFLDARVRAQNKQSWHLMI